LENTLYSAYLINEGVNLEHSKTQGIYKVLVEKCTDGIYVIQSGRFRFTNPEFRRIFGYTHEELTDRDIRDLIVPGEMELLTETIKRMEVGTEKTVRCEFKALRKDGKIIDVEIDFVHFEYHGRGAVLGVVREITMRKRLEDKLKRMAITDELTQLYNRRQFYSQLEKEIERTKRYHAPLSLILLDIDNFKRYNDTHGHVEGDKVLEKLGEIIRNNVRRVDTAYRYGGEEFTVILPETGWIEAYSVADRIRKVFENTTFYPKVLHGTVTRRHLTMSIGLAEYNPTFNLENFVRYADDAMYKAKIRGGNKVVPHEIMIKGTKPGVWQISNLG